MHNHCDICDIFKNEYHYPQDEELFMRDLDTHILHSGEPNDCMFDIGSEHEVITSPPLTFDIKTATIKLSRAKYCHVIMIIEDKYCVGTPIYYYDEKLDRWFNEGVIKSDPEHIKYFREKGYINGNALDI